jgi:hypothetical protein
MTDLRVCTKGVGFAVVGALTTAVLTVSSYGQGGDTVGQAVPITQNVLTFGTTVGYTNTADEVCPYTGSTSPDVWYSYSNNGEPITVSLCNSHYDTKVYLYDGNLQLLSTSDGSANGVACNDDFCTSSGGGGFRSFLTCVDMADAGGFAYIVVDGYFGASGDYAITVSKKDPANCLPPGPCIVDCPAGAVLENETCNFGSGGLDTLNGGCNSSPPVFSDMACDTTYCGTSYFDGSFRDTDWYQLDSTSSGNVTYHMTGLAEFNAVYGRVDNGCGSLDCSQIAAFAEVGVFAGCDPVQLDTAELNNCLAWFFVGTDFTQTVDCNQPAGGPPNEIGDHYVVEVACEQGLLPCPWDFNGDHMVGFTDLVKLLSNWGPCPGF